MKDLNYSPECDHNVIERAVSSRDLCPTCLSHRLNECMLLLAEARHLLDGKQLPTLPQLVGWRRDVDAWFEDSLEDEPEIKCPACRERDKEES
jgi:hypothetical protein